MVVCKLTSVCNLQHPPFNPLSRFRDYICFCSVEKPHVFTVSFRTLFDQENIDRRIQQSRCQRRLARRSYEDLKFNY